MKIDDAKSFSKI